MTEPKDLWLYDDGSWRETFHDDGKVSPLTKWSALPVTDFAALVAERDALKAKHGTAQVAAALHLARAEKAEARVAELEAALRDAREWFRGLGEDDDGPHPLVTRIDRALDSGGAGEGVGRG